MKVMIAAGGTGGHIYPALALADILKKKEPDSEIVFFGSGNRMEADVIPARGYRFFGRNMTGTNGGVKQKVKSVLSMASAYVYCRKLLKEENPDICVGFGNYISVPLIIAAHQMHIPVMLHEANSYAGKANVFLRKQADAIVGCYDSNLEQFGPEKTRILGNPSASQASEVTFDPQTLKQYGLDPEKPFVVIMMGSLGSSSVSKVLDEACPLFDPDIQIIIAAGKDNPYSFRYSGSGNIHIADYVNGQEMLKGCTLAVTRAGATTMAEIGAIGCAAILIPSPYVPNNHQYYNAMELVKKDAAVLLEEKDLTAEKLAGMVNELAKDPGKLETIRDNARKCGCTDAADKMIEWMQELVHNG